MTDKKPPTEKTIRIIRLERGHCLINYNIETTSGGGISTLARNGFDKIEKIHDAVTFARLWLTGDFNALPEIKKAASVDSPFMTDKGRQVGIRTARNGYIVSVAHNDGDNRGWKAAAGDEVVFNELVDTLKFCGDYLEGKPGTNWCDWKE